MKKENQVQLNLGFKVIFLILLSSVSVYNNINKEFISIIQNRNLVQWKKLYFNFKDGILL